MNTSLVETCGVHFKDPHIRHSKNNIRTATIHTSMHILRGIPILNCITDLGYLFSFVHQIPRNISLMIAFLLQSKLRR